MFEETSPCAAPKRTLQGEPVAGPDLRRKRERYTRMACDFCKLRKVRCSGDGRRQCGRCVELDLECTYLENGSIKPQAQIEPVSTIDAGMHTIQQELAGVNSKLAKIYTTLQEPAVVAEGRMPLTPRKAMPLRRRVSSTDSTIKPPTARSSFVFTLNIARMELQAKQLIQSDQSADAQQPAITKNQPLPPMLQIIESSRLVLDLGYVAATQLLDQFHLEVTSISPCVRRDAATKLDLLFLVYSSSMSTRGSSRHTLDLFDVEILKALLGIALSLAEQDSSLLGTDLPSQLWWTLDSSLSNDKIEVEDIIMGSLLCIYYLTKDQLHKALRVSSFTARFCLELGLHTLKNTQHINADADEGGFLKSLFCTVYDLDARCSFLCGVPRVLHDSDINWRLLDIGYTHPYLASMIKLTQVCSEVIEFVNLDPQEKPEKEHSDYLDFKILKSLEHATHESVKSKDQCALCSETTAHSAETIFKLRGCHIRLLLHLQSLYSACQTISRPAAIEKVTGIAREIVSTCSSSLGGLQIGKLFRSTFDNTLMAAASAIFLAETYNPTAHGSACREAFHTAVDILSSSPCKVPEMNQALSTLRNMQAIVERIQIPVPDLATEYFPMHSHSEADNLLNQYADIPLSADILPPESLPNLVNEFGEDMFNQLALPSSMAFIYEPHSPGLSSL